jgi:hypothetical protein
MEVTRDDTFFVHCLYDYILGRRPDAEGLKFWEEYEPRSNLVQAFIAQATKELAERGE